MFSFLAVSVRLAGGDRYQGRVEIEVKGKWGTVCDNRWDIREGDVVCRQLGYVGANQTFKGAQFGEGNGTIWLKNLDCTGNESSLLLCRNAKENLGAAGCTHAQDASVRCKSTPIGELIIFTVTSNNHSMRTRCD